MRVLSCLSIVLLCVTAYLPILWNGFVGDDYFRIVHNSMLQTSSLAQIALTPLYPGDIFRPAMAIFQAMIVKLFGVTPFPLHLASLILHASVCLVLLKFLSRFFRGVITFPIVALFAVHPIHSEAVASISAQSELLMSFFMLLTLDVSLSTSMSKVARLCAIFVLSVCAFCSKESSFSLFLLLPLILSWGDRSERIPLALSTTLSASCVFLLARFHSLGAERFFGGHVSPLDNPLVTLGFTERLPYIMENLGHYLWLHIVPFPLRSDYSYAFKSASTMHVQSVEFLHMLIFIVFCLALLYAFIERQATRVWFYWFFASFAVTANFLFPIGTVFAERLAYLPSIGVVILLVCVLKPYVTPRRREFCVASFVVVALFVTFIRCIDWRDNYTLATKEILVTPQSAKNQYHYGVVLQHQNNFDRARDHFLQAYRIFPAFVEAAHALAMNAYEKNESEEVEYWLLRAYQANPIHVPTLQHLGTLRAQQKQFDEALRLLSKAHVLSPDNFDVKLALLGVYVHVGREEEAHTLLNHLKRRQPDNPLVRRYEDLLVAS